MKNLAAWFKQPTTINGLGVLAGVIAGIVVQLMAHQTSYSLAAGAAVAGILHLVLPDSTAGTAASKLTTDALELVRSLVHGGAGGMTMAPEVLMDILAVLQAFEPTATPVAVTNGKAALARLALRPSNFKGPVETKPSSVIVPEGVQV